MTTSPHPEPRETAPDGGDAASAENQDAAIRRRPAEPIFNVPSIVALLAAACVVVHVARVYLLTADQDFDLLVRTAFIPIRYSGGFELDIWAFTSPITYAFLHGGLAHLLLNMIWLLAFGSPLANRLGVARFVAFWIVTSLGAVALHFAVYPFGQAPLIGASGAISGMMGAAARYGFRIDRSSGRGVFGGPILPVSAALTSRPVATFLIVWFAINLVTGLVGLGSGEDASIAWEAHIGGFLVGFFGIGAFDRKPSPPPGRETGLDI
ncbi:rhomboid family intramembrane serine protease [Arvimicrobium flavum]|uniref:rhomboid family intramembrane serine protease n=1 Tax=Arvimicrobium flavum TaxID=3393320 RepID=UPI00237BFE14|nr:rhomboid family intramembrane serine protease [Mesorhizobium shangrilense]